MSKKKRGVRLSILAHLSIDEGLKLIDGANLKSPPLYIHGERVKRSSDYQRFAVMSRGPLKCYCCGIEATHFSIERHRNDHVYHINCYSNDSMMTWDHIIPKSLGGSNHPDNGRVACEPCNGKRGNEMSMHELLWTLRQDPNKMFKIHQPVNKVILPSVRKFENFIRSAEIRNGALARA